MDTQSEALIDKALAKAGGYDALVDRVAYEARTIRRVHAGEIKMSKKLQALLEKYLAEPKLDQPSKYGKLREAANATPLNPAIEPKLMRQIPVYSKVRAGEALEFDGLPSRWEHTIEYDGKDEKAFALVVDGDSMSPNFPPGTIITVEPKYPPHNGQLVVAKIKDEGFLFKRYHHTGDFKRVTLTSYNPAYPPLELAREELHWLYRVARATQNL